VREVVERIDTPGITGTVMVGMTNPVGQWITQVDIAGTHIDLEAQHQAAIGKFAGLHATEQIQTLRGGAITPR